MSIQIILVPQGAEYQAVWQGVKRANCPEGTPVVVPIPIGTQALAEYLSQPLFTQLLAKYELPDILVMGVCGSLQPSLTVGDVVLYEECACLVGAENEPLLQFCDVDLTAELALQCIDFKVKLVRAFTSARLIQLATEKQLLGETYKASVVDMEGAIALQLLQKYKCRVATIRVVSDDCDRDLPDISSALQTDGKIEPLILARKMLGQPIAAFRLIRGSLTALNKLRDIATQITKLVPAITEKQS